MDILVIALLCFINSRIARKKGRKAGKFIALTLALTWGIIAIGTVIVMIRVMPQVFQSIDMDNAGPRDILAFVATNFQTPLVIITIVGLAVGGGISVLLTALSKRGDELSQQGQYARPYGGQYNNQPFYGQPPYNSAQPPYGNARQPFGMQQPYGSGAQAGFPNGQGMAYRDMETYQPGEMLAAPCTVCIVREQSGAANDLYTFSLNGYPVCQLGNGMFANIMTNILHNTVTARDGSGASLHSPITFVAAAGGYVEIHAKGDRFLPEKTVGRRPAGAAPTQEAQQPVSNIDKL